MLLNNEISFQYNKLTDKKVVIFAVNNSNKQCFLNQF